MLYWEVSCVACNLVAMFHVQLVMNPNEQSDAFINACRCLFKQNKETSNLSPCTEFQLLLNRLRQLLDHPTIRWWLVYNYIGQTKEPFIIG